MDRNESLQDVVPALFRSILSASVDAGCAVEAVQGLLIRQLQRSGRKPNIIAAEGARLIMCRDGKVRTRDLAAALGWSRRHIERVFLNEIGLTPKEFAGLVRFRRAEKALRAGGSLADIALEAGYYDQSHLANDIKRYSGAVPSLLR
jgi:methylphosphotriester-DNA--protein-cysteine methyltransferase